MAKQKLTQQFCLKLHSSFLAQHNWDLNLPIEEARKTPGVVVALADSQILTWINELNGTENYDSIAQGIKQQIKHLKRKQNSPAIKKRIKELYSELYRVQFKEDYLCLIIDKLSDYDRANQGFKINGVEYRRLLTTVNGVKTSTVVYTSLRLVDELKKRIENGKNNQVPLVPAKLGAYEALCSSASIPVSWPHGVIVVSDCITHFKSDFIRVDDSDTTIDPICEMMYDQDVSNNASDGCSMMLPSLAKRWNGELFDDPEHVLSGCNLRCSWLKGMTFAFDFIEWAEKTVGSYIIKDVWGDDRDVRDAELIVTEGQLKLWKCYDNWEDYYAKCLENKYTIRIAKTADHEVDYIRQTNYQYLGPHNCSDQDVIDLCSYTVNELKDIMGMDYRKSIVYLAGSKLSDDNVQYADNVSKALMIEPEMINDPYVYTRIKRMILKRIREAKMGVLDVCGNFQILSGDLVALCEHMFGLEPKGVLKAGEIYSKYWKDQNTERVVCYRSPMSNTFSIVTQNIAYSDDADYWFRYIDNCVVVNAWDMMPFSLNGFDFDGDLLFTTNDPVLLRTHENLPAINCIQYSAEKKIVTEDDVIASNKLGFGSKIGQITNRISCMVSQMSRYTPEDKAYQTLLYRTQVGQALQQEEIDKAKGILPHAMPKSWYIYAENFARDEDSDDIIAKKEFNQSICAHKKPYFFMHNYSTIRTEYEAYMKNVDEKSWSIFGMSYQDLLKSEQKDEKCARFLQWVSNRMPVDMSPSVVNRIAWHVEAELDGVKFADATQFDVNIIKSGCKYDSKIKDEIAKLFKQYKVQMAERAKAKKSLFYVREDSENDEGYQDVELLFEYFTEKCMEICPNSQELCDILIDLCYNGRSNKDLVWEICGDQIIENLLKSHNNRCFYPQKVAENADFECCGSKFSMKKLEIGGEVA